MKKTKIWITNHLCLLTKKRFALNLSFKLLGKMTAAMKMARTAGTSHYED
jgi:hypothetical protein